MNRHALGPEGRSGSGLAGFFMLTFALTWAAWLLALWWVQDRRLSSPLDSPVGTGLVYLGIFAPALAALVQTARRGPRGAIGALLMRLVAWRVGVWPYVVALTYIAAVKLSAAAVLRIVDGAWPAFGPEPILLLVAATVGSLVSGGQVGEELGWRGYALPRMGQRWGLGPASIVLGVIWAVWHLPLFYMPGADTFGQSFPLYLVQVTGLSVAVAWVFGHTGGSLLVVMLMHASLNNMKGIVPGVARPPMAPWLPDAPLFGWVTAAVIWVAAAGFLLEMRRWPWSRRGCTALFPPLTLPGSVHPPPGIPRPGGARRSG